MTARFPWHLASAALAISLVGGDAVLGTPALGQGHQLVATDLVGANAVIGMRYDANEVSDGVTEVLAYGTAVVIESAH